MADVEALALLHAAAFPRGRGWSAREIAAMLDLPGVFVVERESGFALGRIAADEVELLTLAVDPIFRRRGVGGACLTDFEDVAAGRGAVTAFLDVAADNGAARALYARAGYAETGLRAGYYPGGVDAVLMRKPLVGLAVSGSPELGETSQTEVER
ncbi:GNAT family N-acetyltransferase [Aestuariibius sp. 2305UL40-4]|uniref:GNAT family N-acetyltransferase n=1 Tax=Aestuariibius violaceus TaxID=3234132 RepID=UPI00345E7BCA